MVQQGDLLAGKYRVQQLLGAGGMGYVVAAMHEQLGQRVAVKLLVPELSENADSAARFLREARAAVKIHSEHVARVLDVGELTNGSPYMVMEFLSGRDLAEELDQPGEELSVDVAIDYLLQASEAVAEAHSLGIIHRDLKPSNLFLTRRPDGSPLVKVLDFGISKAIDTEDGALEGPRLTTTHSLVGSPAYMSPEQIRRPKQVDARTDIWSLGCTLYELLVKEPPFSAESPFALLAAVVSDPLPSIRDKRGDVSPELEAVVAKCLAKNPDDRYQTVAELAEALGPFAPRSLPSVDRILGIERTAAARSATVGKAPLWGSRQIPSTQVSEGRTQELGRKFLTAAPAAQSQKSPRTDWQALTGQASQRSLAAVGAALGVALVAAAAAWMHWRSASGDTSAERSATHAMPTALGEPRLSAPTAALAPPAPAPTGATLGGAAAPAATPAESALYKKAKLVAPPPFAPAPPAATSSKVVVDPLDGRR